MVCRDKEIPRIKTLQMNNLRGLSGIKKIHRVANAWVKGMKDLMKVFSNDLGIVKE